jgi:hypothetical protein
MHRYTLDLKVSKRMPGIFEVVLQSKTKSEQRMFKESGRVKRTSRQYIFIFVFEWPAFTPSLSRNMRVFDNRVVNERIERENFCFCFRGGAA